MNGKTRCIHHLARLMEHIEEIESVVGRYDSISDVFKSKDNKYIINMCLVQIGEHIRNVKDIDDAIIIESFELSHDKMKKMIGLRNRIVHGYGTIDYQILEDIILLDVPELKAKIEQKIDPDIIKDPYMLYETEYDDFVKTEKSTVMPKKNRAR